MQSPTQQLHWAIKRIAQMQGNRLDGLRLQAALSHLDDTAQPQSLLNDLVNRMGFDRPTSMQAPDAARLPLLAHTEEHGWVVVIRQEANGQWFGFNAAGQYFLTTASLQSCLSHLSTQTIKVHFGAGWLMGSGKVDAGTFMSEVVGVLRHNKKVIIEACVASAFIAMLALATSLFSMQVYDRVIPTRGEHTLIILASGVALVIMVELVMKFARSKIMEHVIVAIDEKLSRDVFSRLLNLRVDQLPTSVGSLAGQIRGYEQVRSFYTSSTLYTLIDIPIGLVFVLLIWFIGHPMVAAVPIVAAVISLYIGLSIRAKISQQSLVAAQQSNLKTGLLVEAVEGIETIKAGSGSWKFLSRWLDVNKTTIDNDMKTRHLTESVSYLATTMQQLSFAGIVVAGAWAVMQGNMTMGALIACSIMGGRVLTPIMQLPNLLVQHANARAAIEGLEKIYRIQTDQGEQQPLTPDTIQGHYTFENVVFAYGQNPPAIQVKQLSIQPGERVILLGSIGSGKSTLLKLLSGLYHPQSGHIHIDGLDITQIHRQVLSDQIGYLQQDHRLFLGTLRENLLVGLPDPGDETLLQAMRRTGMDRFVAQHPLGLQRPIAEGGKGLSGGQKQLLAFTRIILTQPKILLLDEPTATMDEQQEFQCIQVLMQDAQQGKTMVIATHKPNLLPLATRLIVVAGSYILLDGPRDQVIEHIKKQSEQAKAQAQTQVQNPTQAQIQNQGQPT